MSRHDVFLQGEGDAWFMRNEAPAHDQPPMWAVAPLVTFVDDTSTVLEIGCSDGRNLAWLAAQTGCSGAGVDPSDVAIATGLDRHPELDLRVGTADRLPFERRFGLVLLGFCLYLCDREDLPRIVAEVDRVLKPGGCLAIIDFDPPTPRRRRYRHRRACRRTRWITWPSSRPSRTTPLRTRSRDHTPAQVGLPTQRTNRSGHCVQGTFDRSARGARLTLGDTIDHRPVERGATCHIDRRTPPSNLLDELRVETTGGANRSNIVCREGFSGLDVGDDEQRTTERQRPDLGRRWSIAYVANRLLGLATEATSAANSWGPAERTIGPAVRSTHRDVLLQDGSAKGNSSDRAGVTERVIHRPTGHDHLAGMSAIVARSI